MARDRVGRDVFLRGMPEGLRVDRKADWQCSWFDVIQSYGQVRARNVPVVHVVRDRMVMTLDAALARLAAMLGVTLDWVELRSFLPAREGEWMDQRLRRSALASSFLAVLELAKQGKAEIAQDECFGALRVRASRMDDTHG
jgi:segregation and condensation protein A